MKRKNLPLSLVLITIVLGVISLGFENFKGGDNPTFINDEVGAVVTAHKTSSDYLSMIRNNQTSGVVTAEDYMKVQQQLATFDYSRSLPDLKWTQLGPDNYGGRTRAILFDNQSENATVVYAAGVTGGIWKSSNIGVTWNKVNMSTYNLNASCMAQAANGIIYAGTGELFNSQSNSGLEEMGYENGFMGQGVFVSKDGEEFQLLPSTAPNFNTENSDWAFVSELDVNQNSGVVYAATNTGLKVSLNEGATWVTAKDVDGNELSENAYDVKVSSSGSIITAVGNKCYVSLNGDVNNFVLKSKGDSVSLPEAGDVKRIEFAYAPSDANVVYASVVNKFGSIYNIYLSEDKGDTWRVILPGTPAVVVFDGMGVYNNVIKVYPNDPYRILLGGVNMWEGTRIQETGLYSWVSISQGFSSPFGVSYLHFHQHEVVFRPGYDNTMFIGNDGGISIGSVSSDGYRFEVSNRNYFTTQFYNIAPSGFESYVLGGAQGNGSIIVSGEGNTAMQGEQILGGNGGGCAVSLIDRDIMVVSGEGGLVQRTEDAGLNYSNQFLGDFTPSADFFNTPVALWESFDNQNSRDSITYHATSTIPGGTRLQILSANSNQPFYYTTPIDVTLNAGDSIQIKDVVSSRLFIASDNVVMMTKELHNFGKTPEWFEIANSTINFIGDPQCMAYSADGNHLFVGMRDGLVYRISNLALAYDYERADVNSSACIVSTQEIQLVVPGTSTPLSQVVTSIAVDPTNSNNVIVTLGNYGNDHYVLLTENALDEAPSFVSKQSNLPVMPVYSSIVEMSNPDMVIIGTEHGIFVNHDIHSASSQWMKQDSMMGSVPVFQLKQQIVAKNSDTVIYQNGGEIIVEIAPGTNNFGVIYAATFGRGMMRSSTYRKPVAIEEYPTGVTNLVSTLTLYPNPVTTKASIEIDATHDGELAIRIFDLAGRQVAQYAKYLQQGDNKFDLNLSELKSGTYVISAIAGNDKYSQKFIVK